MYIQETIHQGRILIIDSELFLFTVLDFLGAMNFLGVPGPPLGKFKKIYCSLNVLKPF